MALWHSVESQEGLPSEDFTAELPSQVLLHGDPHRQCNNRTTDIIEIRLGPALHDGTLATKLPEALSVDVGPHKQIRRCTRCVMGTRSPCLNHRIASTSLPIRAFTSPCDQAHRPPCSSPFTCTLLHEQPSTHTPLVFATGQRGIAAACHRGSRPGETSPVRGYRHPPSSSSKHRLANPTRQLAPQPPPPPPTPRCSYARKLRPEFLSAHFHVPHRRHVTPSPGPTCHQHALYTSPLPWHCQSTHRSALSALLIVLSRPSALHLLVLPARPNPCTPCLH